MAKDRIVSPEAQPTDEQHIAVGSAAIRPHRLDEYIGQRDLVEKLSIALTAVRQRGEAMEHVLSDEATQRIDRLLGHPTTDPHGQPIPREEPKPDGAAR